MTNAPRVSRRTVRQFAKQHSIDLEADGYFLGSRLVELDKDGSISLHMTDESGTDYYFSQIDFYLDPRKTELSRMIGVIAAGKRTEAAYWTEAAPTKNLTVHQGKGLLVVGNPSKNEITKDRLDPEISSSVTLLSGRFYTIRALEETGETPLVVSGIYRPGVNWDELEIPLQTGDTFVEAPEGRVLVPESFQPEYI